MIPKAAPSKNQPGGTQQDTCHAPGEFTKLSLFKNRSEKIKFIPRYHRSKLSFSNQLIFRHLPA